MINDKQSLILCGIMAGGLFVGGMLDILGNFVVLTILTLVFSTIVINLFFPKKNSEEEKE
tara:strand:- start:82 stop:261 length:180 start_codon:yes stop_codon:yes gene_type:complete